MPDLLQKVKLKDNTGSQVYPEIDPTDKGTPVVANPEMAGSEQSLAGLQIGNTKYKVPQPEDPGVVSIALNGEVYAPVDGQVTLPDLTTKDEFDHVTGLDLTIIAMETEAETGAEYITYTDNLTQETETVTLAEFADHVLISKHCTVQFSSTFARHINDVDYAYIDLADSTFCLENTPETQDIWDNAVLTGRGTLVYEQSVDSETQEITWGRLAIPLVLNWLSQDAVSDDVLFDSRNNNCNEVYIENGIVELYGRDFGYNSSDDNPTHKYALYYLFNDLWWTVQPSVALENGTCWLDSGEYIAIKLFNGGDNLIFVPAAEDLSLNLIKIIVPFNDERAYYYEFTDAAKDLVFNLSYQWPKEVDPSVGFTYELRTGFYDDGGNIISYENFQLLTTLAARRGINTYLEIGNIDRLSGWEPSRDYLVPINNVYTAVDVKLIPNFGRAILPVAGMFKLDLQLGFVGELLYATSYNDPEEGELPFLGSVGKVFLGLNANNNNVSLSYIHTLPSPKLFSQSWELYENGGGQYLSNTVSITPSSGDGDTRVLEILLYETAESSPVLTAHYWYGLEQLRNSILDRFDDPREAALPRLTIDYHKTVESSEGFPAFPKQFTLCDAIPSSNTQLTLLFKSLAITDVIEVGITMSNNGRDIRITSVEVKSGGGSIAGKIDYDVVPDDFVASLSTALNSTPVDVQISSSGLPGGGE